MDTSENSADEDAADFNSILIDPIPLPTDNATAPAEPRLMINYIEIMNFKSYAGKRILGPFHKRFSCIIGPNGSGKSNVIDSMLFVFGYRAQKIRGQKVSLLIHSSDEHPHVSSCKVTIHFHLIKDKHGDPNEYEVVDGSQFSVSRSAFKAGGSSYAINDKEVQFKDVGKLLRNYGVDLDHNRFLILQGEVEQIAIMKPKAPNEQEDGLLEFLEDIIGTNRYKEPLALLEKQAEELSECRAEKLNRARVAETERDNLFEPMQEAVKFLQMENECLRLRHQILQKNIKDINSKIDALQTNLSEIKATAKEVEREINDLKEEKSKLLVESKNLQQQININSRKCDELKNKFQLLEKEDLTCREDIMHSISQADKLKANISNNQKKVCDLEKTITVTQREIEKRESDRPNLVTKVEKAEERVATVKENISIETKEWRVLMESRHKILLEHQGQLNSTKKQLEIAISERELCVKNRSDAESECRKIENDIKFLIESREKHISELEAVKSSLPSFESKTNEIKKEMESLTNKEIEVIEKCQKSRMQLNEMRSQMAAARSRSKILSFLAQQKSEGAISGLYGRLGDLGAIDEKYDVAVSTAGGGYLDFIVVDTMDTAQLCVELLREHSVGSASFIGLDKQQRWWTHIKKCFSAPENVPRIFDLIKVNNEALLPAFYFAFRDTLVAEDLNQAARVAYGRTRYRVVTLSGQLIEISGTLSGGGKPCKGRMGSQILPCDLTPRKLTSSEESLCKLEQRSDQIRNQLLSLKADYDDCIRELRQGQQNLITSQNEINNADRRLSLLREHLKEAQTMMDNAVVDKKSLAKFDADISNYQKAYDEVAVIYEKIQNEVNELNKKIKDHSEMMLCGPKTQMDLARDQLNQSDSTVTKLKVTLKTSKRNLTKITENIEKSKTEIRTLEEKISSLENHLNVLTEKGEKLAREHEASTNNLDMFSKQLADVSKNMKKIDSKITEIEKNNIELRDKEKRIAKEFQSSKMERDRLLNSLDKLQLNELPDCEVEPFHMCTPEEIDVIQEDEITSRLKEMQEDLDKLSPNMNAIKDYKLKADIYLSRMNELNEITEKRDEVKSSHDKLKKQRQTEFLDGFRMISLNVKMMYRTLTLGGDAELELVDSLDPFTEGIEFSVRPPKKSWKKISNISGGEKTLSSLSLIFALHMFKPNPLYFMDEIDAALDFKNVSIVANYIKNRTKGAQFVVISLRNNMFELADRLTGIYKTYNVSKSVTLSPHRFLLAASNHLEDGALPDDAAAVLDEITTPNQNSFTRKSKSRLSDDLSISKKKRSEDADTELTASAGKRMCTEQIERHDVHMVNEHDLLLAPDVEMEEFAHL